MFMLMNLNFVGDFKKLHDKLQTDDKTLNIDVFLFYERCAGINILQPPLLKQGFVDVKYSLTLLQNLITFLVEIFLLAKYIFLARFWGWVGEAGVCLAQQEDWNLKSTSSGSH